MSTLFSELERSTVVGTTTTSGLNLNSTIIGQGNNNDSLNLSNSASAVTVAVASNQLAAAAVAAVNAQHQHQNLQILQQQQQQQTSMNILTSASSPTSSSTSSSGSAASSLSSSLSSVSQQNNLMASAIVVSSSISSQSPQNNNNNNNNSNNNSNNNNINNNNSLNGTATNGMAIQMNPGCPNNSLNLNGTSTNSTPPSSNAIIIGGGGGDGSGGGTTGGSLSGIGGIGTGNVTPPGVPSSSGTPNNLVEDQRALQLAFELSMVGLTDGLTNGGTTGMNSFASILPGMEDRSKKSQNMTECVPVPSSEHVAEIVGRQGCKIKALRAKTNTYIKTPVRGEEPVFVVTGRKEDVGKAKREILSAAEHFSLIRASRKPTLLGIGGATGTNGKGAPPGPPANIPGQVTIQVRVPYRVVGLVVGPKGATIKHIQQQTHTYIVTPSRDKEPIFEVTGLPDNVQAARRQIEAHIALRTGNIGNLPNGGANNAVTAAGINNGHHFNGNCGGNLTNQAIINGVALTGNGNITGTNGASGGISSLLGEDAANSEFLTSLCKNGFGSLLNYVEPTACNLTGVDSTTGLGGGNAYVPVVCSSSIPSTGGSRSCSSSSSSTSSKSGTANSRPELMNIWKNLSDSIDVDEGLGESPNIWTLPAVHSSSTLGSRCSPSISPTDSLLGGGGSTGSTVSNNILNAGNGNVGGGVSINSITGGGGTTVLPSNLQICRRECLMCGDKEVTAALVPCGHNMFCMECANRVCGAGNGGICPVCSQTVVQAIRIIH